MAEAIFNQAGDITNMDDLSKEEVATALQAKKAEVFERTKTAEADAKKAREEAAQAKKDAEEARQKAASSSNQGNNEEMDKVKGSVASLQLAESKRQFGYEHGLSPEETDAVFRVNPNPTKETLDDPFIAGGIKAIKDKKRLASNIPGSQSTSPTFGGKKFGDLSPAEKQAKFPELMAAKLKK